MVVPFIEWRVGQIMGIDGVKSINRAADWFSQNSPLVQY